MNNQALITIFKSNLSVLFMNMDGISEQESVKTSGNGENCINWLLGHIVASRDVLHDRMGLPGICPKNVATIYARGTSGLNADDAIAIPELMLILEKSQSMILEALPHITDVDVIKRVAFMAFHEAYHQGQIGLMRKIIGKKGAIA